MKPAMEVRAFASQVRASPVEDGSGGLRFEGYAALFNLWSKDLGGFREQIAPGAFTKALIADDVRALMNHDPNYVLGRNRSGTLVLAEDDRGLRFEVAAPNAQWACDLYESVKRGDIDQCSFGFRTVRDDWRTADGIDERTLLEVRLFDVSIVTYPAYPEANASVRSCADVLAAHKVAAPAVSLARIRLNKHEREGDEGFFALENASAIGLPAPRKIIDTLGQLKNGGGKAKDANDEDDTVKPA